MVRPTHFTTIYSNLFVQIEMIAGQNKTKNQIFSMRNETKTHILAFLLCFWAEIDSHANFFRHLEAKTDVFLRKLNCLYLYLSREVAV